MLSQCSRAAILAVTVVTLVPGLPVTARPTSETAAERPQATPPPGLASLGYAFKFASAIRSDPKDMGQAQAAVVMDYATAGSLDEAMIRADQIEGWRRGVTYADLATLLARQGRRADATAMLGKAQGFLKNQTGWQGKRVESHIATALSALGRVEESREVAGRLAQEDPQQYTGKGIATVADGQASRGDYTVAMAQLDQLEKDPDIDSAWWRTAGYVALSGKNDLPREQRIAAIKQALVAAANIPGWRRGEALRSIAEAADRLELHGDAKDALAQAEKLFVSLPSTVPVKPALMANLARSWDTLGEKERSRRLLDGALAIAPEVNAIERPGIYANIGYGYQATGQTAEARAAYERALTEAESLTNARPRALAVVEICRSLGKAQLDPDESQRGRLDRIFGNLSDPW